MIFIHLGTGCHIFSKTHSKVFSFIMLHTRFQTWWAWEDMCFCDLHRLLLININNRHTSFIPIRFEFSHTGLPYQPQDQWPHRAGQSAEPPRPLIGWRRTPRGRPRSRPPALTTWPPATARGCLPPDAGTWQPMPDSVGVTKIATVG